MATFEQRTATLTTIWQDNRWLYLLMGFSLGLLALPALQLVIQNGASLLQNLVPEAVGITFTVLIIEQFSRMREEKRRYDERVARVIRELSNRNADDGLRAADEAQQMGILQNGTLVGLALGSANLQGADLHEADFTSARMSYANLEDARLYKAKFAGAILKHTNLRSTFLLGADFTGAKLQNATLNGANLRQAQLTNADLTNASLRQAQLNNTNLERATLPDGTLWTPDTDMSRYTDPNHPDFWQPEWAQSNDDTLEE